MSSLQFVSEINNYSIQPISVYHAVAACKYLLSVPDGRRQWSGSEEGQSPLQREIRDALDDHQLDGHHEHVVTVVGRLHAQLVDQELRIAIVAVHLAVRTQQIRATVIVEGQHQALQRVPLEREE